VEYAGAVYHFLCRADRREPSFTGDDDRALMLETIEKTHERTGRVVHSYVLMPDHYHLLLETPEPNLVAGMKWFQGTYAQRYNRRHRLAGHLFQGRHKAIPVEAEDPDYFRVASDYIHLNLARAKLWGREGSNLLTFRWSSFPAFVQQTRLPGWLCRSRLFESLGLPNERRDSRRRYAARMAKMTAEVCGGEVSEAQRERWRELRRGWYLGREAFGDRLMERIDGAVRGRRRALYVSAGMRRHDEREAGRLLKSALRRTRVSLAELRKRRQTDAVKQGVAWLIKSRTVVRDEWICSALEMGSRTNVNRAVQAYRSPSDRARRGLRKKLLTCAD
jgi:putative transposase